MIGTRGLWGGLTLQCLAANVASGLGAGLGGLGAEKCAEKGAEKGATRILRGGPEKNAKVPREY